MEKLILPSYELLLYLAIAFLVGLTVVSFLWRRREIRILRGLQRVVNTESDYQEHRPSEEFKPGHIESTLKRLLAARKAELDRLKLLENYRKDYIGNVAHELKTPVFSIQGYIEALLDEDQPDPDTLRSFLKKADRNVERMVQLISDLDTITKHENGMLYLTKEDFDLGELVQEVIESLEFQAKEKSIKLMLLSPPGGFRVHGDKNRIRQVLTNLGYNSIKYGKEQGVTRFRLTNTGEKVICEVADNGIGIPQEHLGRIFERFYRVEQSRSRDKGGSGLGLAICKHIIEAHGQQISVISTVNAGSVFSFSLEVADVPVM